MAKRKPGRARKATARRRTKAAARSGKRPIARSRSKAKATTKKRPTPKKARKPGPRKRPQLDLLRRRLEEEVVPTPPSSLNLDRHPSAARTGRAELAENLERRRSMVGVTGGDVDVDLEQAYFAGDEAPGGDN